MSLKRVKYTMLAAVFLITVSGCQPVANQDGKQNNGQLQFSSFRDISGVTEEEINAIEAIKTRYDSFVCAINLNTDSFIDKNGEVSGFAIMFYDWLSGLFGIPFKPVLYEWNDFMSGIASGAIDFTIDLTDTPDRRRVYFMTSPITMRQVKIYRMADAESLESIINRRRPRYAFPVGTNSVQSEVTASADYDFETIFVDSHSDSYPLLESDEIDGHIALDTAEAAFDEFGGVVSEDFFPLIFRSSGLLTRNTDLLPVISVMDKALNDRTLAYLVEMRNAGYQEYLKNKLYTVLTEEERSYIKNNPVVPVAAEFDNYPVSFFDKNVNRWEGIYFDAFREITNLTSLKFECVNEPSVQYPELIAMLENGSALIVPELYHTKEHEGRFLWSEVPLLTDNYAFITRSDFRNIEISEIPYLHVGVHGNTPYCELFTQMFPNHRSHIIYDTLEETWDALKRGDVDVIFTSRRRLVTHTNYNEDAGFKLNLIFSNSFDTSFGFNKDAAVLRSIVDKALRLIKINYISDRWMNKGYDYRQKLAEAQRPLLLGSSIMLVFFLACVTFFLVKSRRTGRRLEKLVRQRTSELEHETVTLKAIFNSSTDYIFCKDLNLRYTRCNKSMEKAFGLSEAFIIGKSDRDSADFSEQTAEKFASQDEQILNGKEFLIFEDQIVSHSDHSKVVFLETIKTPLIQNGKIVGILGISRDITHRKETESELRAASSAKSAFLANMSHELRTPLNVVIGLTDLVLEENQLPGHVKDNLSKISNAGNTLLSIVNDILDFSKIESGKIELTPVEYYMSSLLNDVITLVSTRLGEKPIKFSLNISDDLPGRLYGDDLRVKQIFNNLLSNAIKYTHSGTVELSVSCKREGADLSMEVSVSDTGIGISEENLKKLFSDYNQVDTRANRNIEGTGLGLAITKRLVELMGGEISVNSEYGKGSVFSVHFRQGFVSDTPIGPVVAENLRKSRYADDKRTVGKKLVRRDLSYAMVLIVDDMQTNLDVAAGLLRKYKIQVDCVTNGPEAIERIRSGSPAYNAIFMDHMMPGMDGIETADAIRSIDSEYARKIPIIALTANAIQGTENMFYEHGFQAFISKPIDIMEMDSVIRKWLEKHDGENSDKLATSPDKFQKA
jgi:PAS domain S-box-containing protein